MKSYTKIFISLFLGLLSLTYFFFLLKIWVDTEFRIDFIIEAYSDMSLFELTYHSYQYLTWFFISFGSLLGLFIKYSDRESLKKILVLWIPFWILLDIGSVWLIGLSTFFSYALYTSGVILAGTFFSVTGLTLCDLCKNRQKHI